MYTCEQCGYTTAIKSNYTRHLNRKTSCVPPPPPPQPVVETEVKNNKGRRGLFALLCTGFTLASSFVLIRSRGNCYYRADHTAVNSRS